MGFDDGLGRSSDPSSRWQPPAPSIVSDGGIPLPGAAVQDDALLGDAGMQAPDEEVPGDPSEDAGAVGDDAGATNDDGGAADLDAGEPPPPICEDGSDATGDTDGDGVVDCNDGCPDDGDKVDPGACGCGSPEATGCADPVHWVAIPGGQFDMGSTASGLEQPVHAVNVPAFDISQTEVTVAQYMGCVEAGTCTAPETWGDGCYWQDPQRAHSPVNCVSWHQAVAFCQWQGGRLPSEAEWEYAARSGGQALSYPWGAESPSCDLAVFDVGGPGCGTGLPSPVCSRPDGNTAEGLCDMGGNVFEWVQDGWQANYNDAPSDGSARPGSLKVVRGGGHVSPADDLRPTWRGVYFGAEYNNTFLGIRCARAAQ